ncbi:hypothetical protein BT93_D0052 [Corymbia citriodora subsp. variegata]|nr:hypothetical protein BT93_D0052 [Corymbia citriodora subsp. variegata]
MGRGKIEIRRIENTNNRQVTYSKRRNGIIKKAKEISVLCDAHVAVVIFGCSGKMHEYCSPKASLVDILDQYHAQCGKRLWDAKHEKLSNEIDRIKKANDNLQMQLRHLKGEDVTSLNFKDLMVLEDVLENGLKCIRDQKDVAVMTHRRNLKQKEEVIKDLYLYGQHAETMMPENGRGGDDAYHQRVDSHMPFAFCGELVRPKLQDRI